MEKVYFIGAGPGDPELITVKGQRLVKEADIIIYAGSLVPKQVIDCHKEGAEIYNSASMTLEEVVSVMKEGIFSGKKVARVHTGDPAIFGAHREQMDLLDEYGIDYEVIPGVSSFLGFGGSDQKRIYLTQYFTNCYLYQIGGKNSGSGKRKFGKFSKPPSFHGYIFVRTHDRRSCQTIGNFLPERNSHCSRTESNLGRSENCDGNLGKH